MLTAAAGADKDTALAELKVHLPADEAVGRGLDLRSLTLGPEIAITQIRPHQDARATSGPAHSRLTRTPYSMCPHHNFTARSAKKANHSTIGRVSLNSVVYTFVNLSFLYEDNSVKQVITSRQNQKVYMKTGYAAGFFIFSRSTTSR